MPYLCCKVTKELPVYSTKQAQKIDAPIEKGWQKIANFHQPDWTPEVIVQVDKVGSIQGDKVGAKRLLNGVFLEELLILDNTIML